MSRRRYISTTMAVDRRLNLLAEHYGDFAALLYTWMVPHAEDDGAIDGDLDEFMATVIPMRRDKSREDVLAALSGMAEQGLIEWDGEGSQIQFPVETFYRHQSYITAERRKVATEKRESARISAEQRKTPQNAALFKSKSLFKSSSSSSLSPNGENAPAKGKPLPLPKKTLPSEPWIEEMRALYGPQLRDFEDTLGYWTNTGYYRTCTDKCGYLERKFKEAAVRDAGYKQGKSGGTNGQTYQQPAMPKPFRLPSVDDLFPPGYFDVEKVTSE